MVIKWVLEQDEKVLTTCGTGLEADFWSITRHDNLNTTLAEAIFVEVEAGFTLCYDGGKGDVPCYSDYFEVYIYAGKYTLRYEEVPLLLKPLFNITINPSPTTTLTRIIQSSSFNTQNHSQGVTLAFHSRGACGKVFRIKLFYYYCGKILLKRIRFDKTPSPAKGFKNVTGTCLENSVPSNSAIRLIRYCYPNGTWSKLEDNELKCLYVEGHATITDGSRTSIDAFLFTNFIDIVYVQ